MLSFISTAVAVVMALALATPSAAQLSPTATAPDSSDRMVCKSEIRTGTRFKTRNCKTWREWEAIREAHRRAAKEMIDRPVICAGTRTGDQEGC
jgi:hypothetical protein